MIYRAFVVHDTKAQAFIPPWFLTTDALAKRAFADCVNDKNHTFGAHPEDYNLFKIGTFDDQDGTVTSHAPEALANGLVVLQPDTGPVEPNQEDLFNRFSQEVHRQLNVRDSQINGEET